MPGREPTPLEVHKALADDTRFRLYRYLRLSGRPVSVRELSARLSLHPNTLRPHLRRLEEVGLVGSEIRKGSTVGRPQTLYAVVEGEEPEGSDYRLLAENVTDLVSRHTPSGVYLYASPSFWELIGYTPEELVGRDIYDFIHPDDLEEVQNIHGNILEYPQSHKVSYRFRRKDGDFLWVESNSKTIRNPETGDVQELINVTRDISERMLAKNKLLEKNAELERFAYTISHDLKSPLVTIRGFIGRLLKNFAAGRNENALEYLQRIDHAAGKMEALLSDLLALSVAGKVISAPEKIALAQLVDNVLRLLEGAIQAGRVTVSVQPDLPTVTVDRLRLFQVLQNLLENAIKYRGDQPDLRIRIGARHEGEERVFFVQDNGAGIDRHHQESIFGLFKKLDAKSTGAGIGLATIKRIINAHGGHIWVESDGVGKGSCFCFTLGAFDAGH